MILYDFKELNMYLLLYFSSKVMIRIIIKVVLYSTILKNLSSITFWSINYELFLRNAMF